ncbi:prenyltransferase [uncultured archaeon]|nr:prenyltransferase [uncultured archaeon]
MVTFREIVDYIKLEHTVFDLPFVFSGAVIASGTHYDWFKFLMILVATTTARAAAMSINRIEGKKYDVTNPRKREWSLVRGSMSTSTALLLTAVFVVIFEVSAYLLNTLVLMLSPVVLFLFVTDPFMKKVTRWRHIYMGTTIGVGVLAGYLAVTPVFPTDPQIYLIFIASSLWIAGFDMIYVIPDIEFDRKNNLKTVMTEYPVKTGLRISVATHVVTFAALALLIFYFSTIYYAVALAIILALIIYQHYIINPDDPRTIRMSFLGANSFIGIIFLASIVLSLNF